MSILLQAFPYSVALALMPLVGAAVVLVWGHPVIVVLASASVMLSVGVCVKRLEREIWG